MFAGLWATFVYFPIAHWVFSFDGGTAETGGWIANKLAAIDFAGGTAVHINAGTAGLVLAIILGKRKGWPTTPMRPHNLPFVMLGAGLLWFGWYGFNAGSATSLQRHCGIDVHDDDHRHRGRDAGLAAHGTDPRRQGHLTGRRVGHRGRFGRHHAVLLARSTWSARS